jgi:5-methyltetrahydropteroyltriglutamate--homocysteine methyltransferase
MIPTEPIGSIPRPKTLIDGQAAFAEGTISREELRALQDDALADTIERLEETGSPVISDGEQTKSSFVTYPLDGVTNLAPDGVVIPFEDGHTRQLPTITAAPFRFGTYASSYLTEAKKRARVPVKQAVIASSVLSLLYPQDGIEGYPREAFLEDLVGECEKDIRTSLDAGAFKVQIDFTEGRLACKLDPSGGLLRDFVALNNRVLERFSDDERTRIGVHTCPGGDRDSTHSADVDYLELLPSLFQLKTGRFYVALAHEPDRARVLRSIQQHMKPDQMIFVGVTAPINPRIETAEEIRDQVLEAARYIPVAQLGTTDDCGFSPFSDDTSTTRDAAFAKIGARVRGTALAGKTLSRP